MCEFEYLTYISQKQDRETDLKSDRITLGHQWTKKENRDSNCEGGE